MKIGKVAEMLMVVGAITYFGPQIDSLLSDHPKASSEEYHILGAIAFVGGLVLYAISTQRKPDDLD